MNNHEKVMNSDILNIVATRNITLLKYLHNIIFCSKAFPQYLDVDNDDNPTVASDMLSKNILLYLIFEQT